MSSAVTSSVGDAGAAHGATIASLRSPRERAAFAVCVVSNVLVLALAVAIVFAGTSWIAAHPLIGKYVDTIRAILIAAIVAIPTAAVARNIDFHEARNDGVRVHEAQFSELYARYLGACRELGLERVPELYLSREIEGTGAAHTVWDGSSVVVINAELVDHRWRDGLDWLTFLAARQLGAIRLGHTRWWTQLLTVYSRQIPGLRTPIHVQWAHSRDRCAAHVVPDGIRGLIVEAVGNHALDSVDVRSFVAQTERVPGIWDRVAAVRHGRPSLLARARALYASGFFDRARDRERESRDDANAIAAGAW